MLPFKRLLAQVPCTRIAETPRKTSALIGKEEPVWRDPFKNIATKKRTITDYQEININWDYVKRLMPLRLIPKIPRHKAYPTPSGWCPPKENNTLPYFVSRCKDHLFPLYLRTRRDTLDPSTMDFTYVELVELKNVWGDVFGCAKDLQNFLEAELNHPVAVNADELKGRITVKGVERSLLEKFLMKAGF